MTNEKAAEVKKPEIKDVIVQHKGEHIILPLINGVPMSFDDAILWLKRKKEEDELETNVFYTFPCYPLDGAVAFQRALSKKYGWAESVPTPGFFGDRKPVMVGVQISATEKINVPWGRMQVPAIAGHLDMSMGDEPQPHFILAGVVKKKHANDVKELARLTEEFLKTESIYRGKAVKVDFGWKGRGEDFHPMNHAPKFLELSNIKDDDLIFGDKTVHDIEIGLFTPIEQTDACRRYSIPLKRGVLLYGPYGTGKTMTAYVSALKAVRNGWTFVYLDSVKDLKEGLEFAAQYAPCVLFAEDIDRVINGERSLQMDEVLNTLDGVDTKGAEIITVFTTNHIEAINPAMLRMGRLDTLVEVLPPDEKAAERLVRLYVRGLLAESADLTRIGKSLAGKIPAFIREVTERSKIAAIARTNGADIEGKVLEEDILAAASAMETHNELLQPKAAVDTAKAEMLLRIPEGHKGTTKIMKMIKDAA